METYEEFRYNDICMELLPSLFSYNYDIILLRQSLVRHLLLNKISVIVILLHEFAITKSPNHYLYKLYYTNKFRQSIFLTNYTLQFIVWITRLKYIM